MQFGGTLTKAIGLGFVVLSLSACSTISSFNESVSSSVKGLYSNKPEVIGNQPLHLMPHKDQLAISGPVKKVSYFFTRPDFTGSQETEQVHLEFNESGYITRVTGSPKALETGDFIKYWDLPENTALHYDKNDLLDKIENAEDEYRHTFVGKPERYNEKNGDLKSFVFTHTQNEEKKYRTLDHMIYAGSRYMVLSKDNRKREKTKAKIYEYKDGRLHKVYVHEEDYPLSKKPSASLRDPTRNDFRLEKEINHDLKGRVYRVMTSMRKGALVSEDRISYEINSNLPKQIINIDGKGAQQYRTRFNAYETDEHGNWISRKVITSYRRGDKEGSDRREIEYYKIKD